MKWVDLFCERAERLGIGCRVARRANGWAETVMVGRHRCFTKSVTYNTERGLYFLGVDPSKLKDRGDMVLICGGVTAALHDIFVFPWGDFFSALKQGEPINTYRLPKEYWQYKFAIRDHGSSWFLAVQGAKVPPVDISKRRHTVESAVRHLLI